MSRIYDDATHPSYGPVRRAWVILAGLYGDGMSEMDTLYQQEWGTKWDTDLHILLTELEQPEGQALRRTIWKVLACLELGPVNP